MSRRRPAFTTILMVTTYFVCASISCILFSLAGGPALLWSATAFMIAALGDRPRREWWPLVALFLLASVLANGLFGLGWGFAPKVAFADIAEGLIATYLFSRRTKNVATVGSLAWLTAFVIPVAIAAPLIVGTLMVLRALAMGEVPNVWIAYAVLGHILGNVTFAPVFLMVRRRGLGAFRIDRASTPRAARLLGLVIVVTVGVFLQNDLPLLFLPVLPLMLVSFRLGKPATLIGVLLIGVIGTILTLSGSGPIKMIDATLGNQMSFFQFYLACTVLLGLPIAADLEQRKRLHAQLRSSEERYRLLAEHSTDILLHLELDGTIRFVSPSIRGALGFDPATIMGAKAMCLVHPDSLAHVIGQHEAVIAARGKTHVFEYVGVSAAGAKRYLEAHARAICDPLGRPEGVLSIVRDVTARKLIEVQLTAEAMADPLTGLCNRRAFERLVDRRAGESGGGGGDCIAVFDIDHFKTVNDRFGHDAGDAVLGTFARVLRDVMRDGDVIARTGGEEFAVLLCDTSAKDALSICDRLLTTMAAMETLCGGARIRVTVSGGVAILGPRGLRRALKEADEALYRAKRNGRDQMAIAA